MAFDSINDNYAAQLQIPGLRAQLQNKAKVTSSQLVPPMPGLSGAHLTHIGVLAVGKPAPSRTGRTILDLECPLIRKSFVFGSYTQFLSANPRAVARPIILRCKFPIFSVLASR
jgi:hypothetical protein